MVETLDMPQINVSDMIALHGRHKRDKLAVICGTTQRTWAEFDANINRVAHALIDSGLKTGDKVAIVMQNSVEMLEVLFGAIRAGGCAVPLSGLLTPEQLCQLVDDSDSVRLFISSGFADALAARCAQMPKVARDGFIGVGFSHDGWRGLADFTAQQPATAPDRVINPGDDLNIIYSSGTTGLPKGIVQTHAARLHFAFSNAIELGIGANARTLTTTSLYSNGTWIVMLPTLFAGGTLYVMEQFDTDTFLSMVQDHRITHSFMVPAQYIMILENQKLDGADLSSLEMAMSAGSPLRRNTKRDVLQRISPNLIELYGFSEGYASMLKADEHDAKFETVGRPVMGFDLRIIDTDGNECPPGTPGEIVGYGAGMLREYHARPELTAELIWRDERGRSFIRSGDIGMLDEDGFLTIVDRKKDMIVSGGFNVFPTDVEAVIGQHPEVSDVAVIGVPHDKWGETCLALVIARPGQTPDPDAIRLWANERLAKHQRINAVELRDAFPRNALGKVLKRQLRDPYWQ